MSRFYVLSLLIMTSGIRHAYAQDSYRPTAAAPELRTTGSSTKTLPADVAQLTFEFTGTGKSVSAAYRAAAAQGKAIRQALISIGIPGDSLQSRSFGRDYYYYWDDRMQVVPRQDPKDYTKWDTTFVLRDVIVARIRNMANIGLAIDTAIATGAKRVAGMQFGTTPSKTIENEVLAEATQVARRNAEIMATANGGQLGRLIELSTQALNYEQDGSRLRLRGLVSTATGGGDGTTVVPASLALTVTVYGRWEYKGQ